MLSFKKLVYCAVIPALVVTTIIYSSTGTTDSSDNVVIHTPTLVDSEDVVVEGSSEESKDENKGSDSNKGKDESLTSSEGNKGAADNTSKDSNSNKGTSVDKDKGSSSKDSNKGTGAGASEEKDKIPSADGSLKPEITNSELPQKPKGPSYFKLLKDINRHLNLVKEDTPKGMLQGILIQDNFLDSRPRKLYDKDQMFPGSPELHLKSKEIKVNGKKLTVLDMEGETEKFKKACINYLNSSPEGTSHDFTKALKWCLVPTIKEAMLAHGFPIFDNSFVFREVAFFNSEWIFNKDKTYSKYLRKLNYITKKRFEEAETVEYRSYNLYLKYRVSSLQPYELTDFPATSVEGMSLFQKTSLFGFVPFTAGQYLAKKYGITEFEKITNKDKEHFFYEEGMSIEDYKNVSTLNTMNGKSVWGAIKFLYDKRKAK